MLVYRIFFVVLLLFCALIGVSKIMTPKNPVPDELFNGPDKAHAALRLCAYPVGTKWDLHLGFVTRQEEHISVWDQRGVTSRYPCPPPVIAPKKRPATLSSPLVIPLSLVT